MTAGDGLQGTSEPAGQAVRSATLADVDAVLAFWALAAEGTDRHDTVAAVSALIRRDVDALRIITDHHGIAATLIAGWDGWRASLYRLAVRPDRRRQGLARVLLTEAEQRLTMLGAHRSDAMVLDTNTDAHPAWATQGYEAQPEWSRWVKPLRPL